jgi:hypothetical protein
MMPLRTSRMSAAAFAAFLLTHPISGSKGDEEIKAQESQQAGFNTQLRSIFSDQFGKQTQVLNFLSNKLTSQVNNPEGFTPEQKAALETTNTEGAAKAYTQAEQATRAAEASRGGSVLPSGVSAQLSAANSNAGAAQLATGENAIALADAQTKQNNTWRALSGLDSVAASENPSGYGTLANGGAATVGELGTEYNQSQQSPLLAALGGIAGAGISAIGTYYGRKPKQG